MSPRRPVFALFFALNAALSGCGDDAAPSAADAACNPCDETPADDDAQGKVPESAPDAPTEGDAGQPDASELDAGDADAPFAIPPCDLSHEPEHVAAYRRFAAELSLANGEWSLRCGLYASRDVLADFLRLGFRDACSGGIPLGLREGRVRFDAEAGAACLALQEAGSCADDIESACAQNVVGAVPPDGACYGGGNGECVRGYDCDLSDSCPGRCVPRVALGSDAPGTCIEGATRDATGACSALVAEGEPCTPDGIACAAELYCSEAFVCTRRPRRAAGESCADPNAYCAGATYCDGERCTPLGKLGERCQRFECQVGLQCRAGQCAALRTPGEPCSEADRCAYPYLCLAGPGDTRVCSTLRAEGERCASAFECEATLYCPRAGERVCTARVSEGGACDSEFTCADGLYCAGVTELDDGVCAALKANGEECEGGGECASFGCDGVCQCFAAGVD